MKKKSVRVGLGNGYWLSIVQEVYNENRVEVALLNDSGFVNTGIWYYELVHEHVHYDDVIRFMDAYDLIIALTKAKAYAKGEHNGD